MKYICDYAIPGENQEGRQYVLSSMDKLEYIVSAINRCGENVDIISPSCTRNKKGFYKGRVDALNDGNRVISAPTFGVASSLGRILQRSFALLWLMYFLVFRCQKGERIAVYHSVFYVPALVVAQKLRKIRVLLEVEEVFHELSAETSGWRVKMEESVIRKAESYIFASKQLEQRCNQKNKPYAIANGRYIAAPAYEQPADDGKIHLVYAGLIEREKVAFNSVRTALYLPENYVIHIIGYGNDEDIQALKELVDEVNGKARCRVVFDGTKRGEEYDRYLQQCHIGLCPLIGGSTFQNACFPSKITSYLSNGLLVVTTENEVIRTSEYGRMISFSEDYSPEKFAKAILAVEMQSINTRETITTLDKAFVEKMAQMLRRVKL